MRRTRNAGAAGFGTRSAMAIGLAGTLLLSACGSQVGGTALAPTAQASSSPTVASLPSVTAPSSSSQTSTSDETAESTTVESTTVESTTVESTTADSTTAESTTAESTTAESTTAATPDETSASSGTKVDPAAFAAKLKSANAGVKSLKGSIAVTADTVNVTGTFGETLSGGQVNALDMSMFITSGANEIPLRMLIVDGKVFVGGTTLLKSLGAGTKKWALASKTSSDATLRTLADQLDGYLTTASANQYELYALAAKSIVDAGPARIGSVSAHRYDVTVDVAALGKASPASTKASMDALVKAGVTTIPATLWVDDTGRLLQSESTVKVSGITSKSDFKVTGYNVPVTVTAPAAADVYTG